MNDIPNLARRRFRDPAIRRLGFRVLLAAACLTILATHVHVGFDRVRFRVVTEAQRAVERALAVPLPDLTSLADAPAAVVIRLRGTAEPSEVTVTLDGTPLSRVRVRPGREVRVDLATAVEPGPGRELVLTGDRSGWELTYLEVANVFGFNEGLVRFVLVPRERPRDAALPPWFLGTVAVVLLSVRLRPDWPKSTAGRRIYVAGAGLVFLLFGVTFAADTVTQYKVLLSPGTFVLCAAILYADPMTRGLRTAARHGTAWAISLWRIALRPAVPLAPHAVVAVVFAVSVAQFYDADTGFTTFIVFGDQFEARAVPALIELPRRVYQGSGYDGQFYAQLAFDPLLRDSATIDAMDNPAYRARRMLVPLVAWLAGAGRPEAILHIYSVLNLVAWALLSALLLRWLTPGRLAPTLAWAACVLSQGLLSSVRQALPDGPSVLLLAAAIVAVERNRHMLAAGVLGLAGLARETNLLGGVLLGTPEGRLRQWAARLAGYAVLVGVPLLSWGVYLRSLGLASHDTGLRNFAFPLAGYVGKWTGTLDELYADPANWFAWFSLLTLVALTTQAAALLRHRQWQDPWWRLGAAYVGLLVVLGPAVWAGHPPAVTRVVLPLTIAFNVLLPRMRGFWPLLVLGNANLLHGLDAIRVPWLWN